MVLLGKTNLSEWANIRSEHSTSGWSAHGGLTRNPYALNRTAWGSSSGSGAAVAARLAAYAVGTETNGSITAPAAVCGLVGLKPTVGLVPTEGVVPISWSQDSPGPMALTVADTAALLDAMAGTSTADGLEHSVRGMRIGVPRDLWGYSPAADAASERALSMLSHAGAVVVDDLALPALKDLDDEVGINLMLVELKVSLATYLATRDAEVKTLADVIAFNRRNADTGDAVVRPGAPREGGGDVRASRRRRTSSRWTPARPPVWSSSTGRSVSTSWTPSSRRPPGRHRRSTW